MGSIVLKEDDHEKYHYVGMHGLQAEKLYDHQEQADHAESPGTEKILQVLPVPQAAQRDQVIPDRLDPV